MQHRHVGMLKTTFMTEEQYEEAICPSDGPAVQDPSGSKFASNPMGKRRASEPEQGRQHHRKKKAVAVNHKLPVAVVVAENTGNAEARPSTGVSPKRKGKEDISARQKGLDAFKVCHTRNSKTNESVLIR